MHRRIVRQVGDDMRVRLPRSVREALEISEGDALELSEAGTGTFMLARAPSDGLLGPGCTNG